jgi:hypothetical protein
VSAALGNALANAVAMLRIEARRGVGLLLFVPVVAAFALLTRESLTPVAVWLFPVTVSALRPNLLWLGPLAGGLAAWSATRERRRGTEELLATTPSPATVRDLAAWAAVAGWCCLAYASVCAAFLLATHLNATWGSPTVGPVLTGLLQVAALSALGYAAGRWLPGRFTPPFVAIALFSLLVVLGGADRFGIGSLSPAAGPVPSVWHEEVPDLQTPQTLVFAGLLGIGLVVTALKEGRSPRSWGALLAAALASILGIAMLLNASPPTAAQEREAAVPYAPVCEKGDGGIPVCVHPAYEALLPQAAGVVNHLAAPLAGVPGGPARAEQVARGPADLRPDGALVFTLPEFGDVSVRYWGYGVAAALTRNDVPEVLSRSNEACRGADDPSAAQDMIAAWLVRNADGSVDGKYFGLCHRERDALTRFAALPPDERRAWLAENYAGLRAGEVVPRDLP